MKDESVSNTKNDKIILFYLGRANAPISFIKDKDDLLYYNGMGFEPRIDKNTGEISTMILKKMKIDIDEEDIPLSTIVLPEWCSEIYEYAIPFQYREHIETVFATGLKIIDNQAFAGCRKLKKIYANNLEKIRFKSFKGCYSLQYVPNLNKIVKNGLDITAFEDCYYLRGYLDENNKEVNTNVHEYLRLHSHYTGNEER